MVLREGSSREEVVGVLHAVLLIVRTHFQEGQLVSVCEGVLDLVYVLETSGGLGGGGHLH